MSIKKGKVNWVYIIRKTLEEAMAELWSGIGWDAEIDARRTRYWLRLIQKENEHGRHT